MAVIVNGDGILTGVSSLTTALDDITSGRGTVTGVATVGTLQLGAGVSISSPRTQNAAIFTNNSEFLTIDDAGRVGVGTVTPNSDAHPQNVGKINVGFITARSVAGDIDANTLVVAGISTFVGNINLASSLVHTGDTDTKVQFTTDNISLVTGGTTRVNITSGGNLEMPNDNDYIKIGASGDLQLVHTGSSSNIVNTTGALQLQSSIIRFDNASGTEYGRFDSSGRLNVGAAAAVSQARNVNIGSNAEANLAIETHNDAASESANIRFYKSRGTAGSPTAIADNHYIGQLIFYGQDGTDYANTAAYMRVQVDGTVASNQIPGEMEFGINDGSSATRAMTIHKSGNVLFSGLTAKNDPRNAKGINLKSVSGGAGISFETFGSNGSRNWRIRPDDMTGWGTLEFSVSPTANDTTDWPDTAGDVVMSLESGNVKLTNADLVMGNGKGISFAATSNSSGSTSSELFDDYEEGSWTPVLESTSTNPTISSYQVQQGRYTKIGNIVYIFCFMDISAGNIGGTLTGDGKITGLPFSISNTPSSTDVHGSACDNLKSIPNTFSAQRNNAMLYFPPGQDYLAIHQYSTVNPIYQTGWGMSQIGNGDRFKWAWTGQYRTDA